MKIGGLKKFTVTDYPGKISCIVFALGCNFRCPFCHNSHLVECKAEKIPTEKILGFLEERSGQLEGVVVTGGEPFIQGEIFEFLEKIKQLDYSVKIDTNGSLPEDLKNAVERSLVDYVAMDIKAPLDEYKKAAGIKVDRSKLEKSIDIIMNMENYEFRTTAVPGLIDEQSVEKIARRIDGAKNYFIQQFEPRNTLDPEYSKREKIPVKKLQGFKKTAERFVRNCKLRNV